MRVWIDLSNSPHPLLFAPIARRLEELGHEALVTARDNAQTLELAKERWPEVEEIGAPSPGDRLAKITAIAARTGDLYRWAKSSRPDVALSHNSYAQIAAAWAARIPAVTAMDYEHQPSNHIAFRLANRILIPEALPVALVRRQGARLAKVRRYPGLKEEIYLGDFRPDPNILETIGVERRPGTIVVLLRAPPTGALYHQFENPLYGELLDRVEQRPDMICIVLARTPEQRRGLERLTAPNVVVPNRAIDSRSVMYASDVFVGAGGTMTREAALLGVPTLTIYAGRPPAIEEWLEQRGMLSRLTSPELEGVGARTREPAAPESLRVRGAALAEVFVEETLATART